MRFLIKMMICFFVTLTLIVPSLSFARDNIQIPILVYHNFNPTKRGSMNLTPAKVEAQIKWIKENGYTIIPLKEAVSYLQGKRSSLPNKSVVITADDGWQSDHTYLLPIVRKYQIPVTLFIYPGTISEGKNALTWQELTEMKKTGLFDIQSHTLTHPNFKQMKKRLSKERFQAYVQKELTQSKKILEEKMGIQVTLLAWPFGIYNDELEQAAQLAGYDMAFTIDALPANRRFKPMAQPRYMIVEGLSNKTFTAIVKGAN